MIVSFEKVVYITKGVLWPIFLDYASSCYECHLGKRSKFFAYMHISDIFASYTQKAWIFNE